ncbi:MAG: hypothetical protein GJ677_17855 [Rhodobacteraceae bacterium]|nr:hypothetical protein [Paracoccaceae bacterium]
MAISFRRMPIQATVLLSPTAKGFFFKNQSDQSHQNEAYLDPSMLQLAVFAELSRQASVAFWHF